MSAEIREMISSPSSPGAPKAVHKVGHMEARAGRSPALGHNSTPGQVIDM